MTVNLCHVDGNWTNLVRSLMQCTKAYYQTQVVSVDTDHHSSTLLLPDSCARSPSPCPWSTTLGSSMLPYFYFGARIYVSMSPTPHSLWSALFRHIGFPAASNFWQIFSHTELEGSLSLCWECLLPLQIPSPNRWSKGASLWSQHLSLYYPHVCELSGCLPFIVWLSSRMAGTISVYLSLCPWCLALNLVRNKP